MLIDIFAQIQIYYTFCGFAVGVLYIPLLFYNFVHFKLSICWFFFTNSILIL